MSNKKDTSLTMEKIREIARIGSGSKKTKTTASPSITVDILSSTKTVFD